MIEFHAVLRAHYVQLGRHALEDGAVGLTLLEEKVEQVLLACAPIDHQGGCLSVAPDIRRGLGEELVREGDVIAIHVIDVRKIRYVRDAHIVDGCNQRRNTPSKQS